MSSSARRRALRTATLLICIAGLATSHSARRPSGASMGLPLVEVPATRDGSHVLAILLTGDGDWTDYMQGVAQGLATNGIAVVGLESHHYLRRSRSPDEVARDVVRMARHYMAAWRKEQLLLVGYSRGADFAPFVTTRLPADLHRRLTLVALLSPSRYTAFEFRLADLVSTVHRPGDLPTLPEVARMGTVPVLCMYGIDERESLCTALPPGSARVVARPGGHRTSDHQGTVAAILGALTAARPLAPRPQ